MHRKLFTLILLLALLGGFAARANAERIFIYRYRPAPVFVYQAAPTAVSYDAHERLATPTDLQGVVTLSVPYHINVRIHNEVYSVSLHQGTIIKPTGITLSPSMVVNLAGYWSGEIFHANRIVVLR